MGTVAEKKKQYNELLSREKKAQLYIDNPNVSMDKILNLYIPEYQRIVQRLSKLLNEIGSYTQQEALEGFKI